MITASPSKSHTMRALFFAFMASGKSKIYHYLPSPDTSKMIDAMCAMGSIVTIHPEFLEIVGVGGKPKATKKIIDSGNSGLIFRFMVALCSLMNSYSVITGDESICHRRPIKPLLKALKSCGVFAESTVGDGYAPVIIKGPLRSGEFEIEGSDSQPVSALLMVLSFLEDKSIVKVINPGEKKWVELTLFWLKKLGFTVVHLEENLYQVGGLKGTLKAFDLTIPGDYSSATYPLALAFLKNKRVKMSGLDRDDLQPDRELLDILLSLGAKIEYQKNGFLFEGVNSFKGSEIYVGNCIDCLPLLALIFCFATTPSRIYGGTIARKKESDRISAITKELRKMGASIEEKEDGMLIFPSSLMGHNVESYFDHRIAMTLTIALKIAQGEGKIDSTKMIQKSYPSFFEDIVRIEAL